MSRIVRTTALPALAVAAVLALAGCAGGGSTTTSEESSSGGSSAPESGVRQLDAAPASGTTITGDGYSYSVPEGWDAPPEQAGTAQADTLAADLNDTDGFADNVNVLKSPAGEVSADDVETLGVDELETAGATDVQVQERVEVAGSESAHLSATLTSANGEFVLEQYYLTEGGQTYVVTFSYSPTVDQTERTATAESILVSWSWA